MFFTMYPVLLVLYFCFRGQYQYADGCLFAVNMKPEWIKEPEVAAIVEKFRREMKQYFIFLLIAGYYNFHAFHKVLLLDLVSSLPNGPESGFIYYIGKLRA